jgi:hypothetical protein
MCDGPLVVGHSPAFRNQEFGLLLGHFELFSGSRARHIHSVEAISELARQANLSGHSDTVPPYTAPHCE